MLPGVELQTEVSEPVLDVAPEFIPEWQVAPVMREPQVVRIGAVLPGNRWSAHSDPFGGRALISVCLTAEDVSMLAHRLHKAIDEGLGLKEGDRVELSFMCDERLSHPMNASTCSPHRLTATQARNIDEQTALDRIRESLGI